MRASSALTLFVVGPLAASACTPAPLPSASALSAAPARAADPAQEATPAPAGASVSSPWAGLTQSPWPADPSADADTDARAAALAALCGEPDGALARVARELVAIRARGLGAPDSDAVVAKLRAAGEPYVRPRTIFATGHAPIDEANLRSELRARRSQRGRARCGVGIAALPHGGEMLVAIQIEALADLSPLPTRARTGEWLSFAARVHVAARSAKLVVLGPRGAPHTVPTSLDAATGMTRARFALDQPGAFTVQLVGDLPEGPRPLLEARVFADVSPTAPGEEGPAPGEEAGVGDDALARMVTTLRSLEGAPTLARNAKLDALARAHAERMRDRHAVAHDLGDGDFRIRFEAEGTLDARAVGENVAHAPSVALAHRALHASPSHRINLLRADYTHMGIGVAHADDGSVYVCETFAATSRSASRK